MKSDMVQQYYKCPTTGMEMRFTKTEKWGWSVCFPFASITETLDYEGEVPFPKLSDSDQKTVDANYQKLHEMMENTDD